MTTKNPARGIELLGEVISLCRKWSEKQSPKAWLQEASLLIELGDMLQSRADVAVAVEAFSRSVNLLATTQLDPRQLRGASLALAYVKLASSLRLEDRAGS